MTTQRPAVVEWAQTAAIEQPVRWGRIEAEVLAREPVGLERLPRSTSALVGVGWLATALNVAITAGAPVIGVALLAVGAAVDDPGTASGWSSAAGVAFAVTAFVQALWVRVWWVEHRRRATSSVVSAAVAVLCAAIVVGVLVTADDLAKPAWLDAVVILAAVMGLVVLALMATSDPVGRAASRTPPRRGPTDQTTWIAYTRTRDTVLDILTTRGLVELDQADRTRMSEMPLGYWDELDDVDDAERRRILELRSVGWRDFDESDRRPWPPAPR